MVKAAFPCMRIIYPTDFVRTTFVRVTKSDQTFFNVGVSICTDFSTEKKTYRQSPHVDPIFHIFRT